MNCIQELVSISFGPSIKGIKGRKRSICAMAKRQIEAQKTIFLR